MRVNYIDAQFIGKSHYDDRNGGASRTYCHFLYKSPYVEGYATIVIPIYDNDRNHNVNDLVMKENYKVIYVSDRGYNQLVQIEKI